MESESLDRALELARLRRRLPAPAARRHIRESAGVSQIDVARALGVTRECVCLWEMGHRTPREKLGAYVGLLDRLAREGRS